MATAMDVQGRPLDPRPMWRVLAEALSQQGKRVVQAEATHLRQEAQEGMRGAVRGSLLLGGSAWLALTGLNALVVAAVLAVPARPVRRALWTGLGLLGGALALGAAGLKALPTRPVQRTLQGLKADVAAVKEGLASAPSGTPADGERAPTH